MKVLLSIFLILLAALFAVAGVIFTRGCGRRKSPLVAHSSPARPKLRQHIEQGKAWFLSQPYTLREITSFDGLKLKGYYLKSRGRATLILMHGYHAEALYEFAPQLRFYHEAGFDILLPDQRAHGNSEGKYLSFGILEAKDTAAWAEHIHTTDHPEHIILGGISMGGATVCMASLQPLPPTVRGIIADCPFGDPGHQFRYSLSRQTGWLSGIFLYLCGIWSRLLARWHFTDISASDYISATLPLLLIHGTADPTVPHRLSQEIADNYGGNVQRHLFEDCAHAYAYLHDTERYRHLVTQFIENSCNLI